VDNQILLQLGGLFGSATGVLAWQKVYARVVFTRLKTKDLRRQRWNKLLEAGGWESTNPLLLEDAFAEAHGYALSDRDIRFALGRSNPSSLLRELRQCKGMVRLTADGAGYAPWRGLKFRRWNYHAHSVAAFVLGYLPFSVLFILAPFLGKLLSVPAQVLLLVFTFAVLVLGLFMASWFEAAHRVVEEVDERYPRWTPGRPECLASNDVVGPATTIAGIASNDAA
jgi:hypothetical protein